MLVHNYSHFSPDPVQSPIAQGCFLEHPDDVVTYVSAQAYLSEYHNSITPKLPKISTSECLSDGPLVITHNLPPTCTDCASPSTVDAQDNALLDSPSPPRIPAADDTLAQEEPSRHVDYLSHKWGEEDIRASWRYVVLHRDKYENSARLENAAWRAWAKVRNNLGTISPVALNWMKDSDDTWLYGPLKTAYIQAAPVKASLPTSYCQSRKLCRDRKPILKKRTVSETILQRSPSPHFQRASAILKAPASERSRNSSKRAIQHQESRPMIHKLYDLVKPPRAQLTTKTSASGAGLPSAKRQIHFNQEVLQCIAITKEEEEEEEQKECLEFADDLCWDKSYIVKVGGSSGKNKTIAPLPPTTLKYHCDTPEPQPAVGTCWSWKRYIPMY